MDEPPSVCGQPASDEAMHSNRTAPTCKATTMHACVAQLKRCLYIVATACELEHPYICVYIYTRECISATMAVSL